MGYKYQVNDGATWKIQHRFYNAHSTTVHVLQYCSLNLRDTKKRKYSTVVLGATTVAIKEFLKLFEQMPNVENKNQIDK